MAPYEPHGRPPQGTQSIVSQRRERIIQAAAESMTGDIECYLRMQHEPAIVRLQEMVDDGRFNDSVVEECMNELARSGWSREQIGRAFRHIRR